MRRLGGCDIMELDDISYNIDYLSVTHRAIIDDRDEAEVIDLTTDIKNSIKDVTEQYDDIVMGAKEFINRAKMLADKSIDKLKGNESTLKKMLLEYRESQVEQVDRDIDDTGTSEIQLYTTVKSDKGRASYKEITDYEVVAIDRIPRKYLELNKGLIRKTINAKINIPGIKVFKKSSVSIT